MLSETDGKEDWPSYLALPCAKKRFLIHSLFIQMLRAGDRLQWKVGIEILAGKLGDNTKTHLSPDAVFRFFPAFCNGRVLYVLMYFVSIVAI